MINNITYLVSSNIRYGEPLKRLRESMSTRHHTNGGIHPGTIITVIGGSDGRYFHRGSQGLEIHMTHNSFDYTALIELVGSMQEKPNNLIRVHQHVFLLHDTMEFTDRTHELIRQADPDVDATAACDDGPGLMAGQCNMCLFRTDYLLTQRDWILGMRNCSKLAASQGECVLFRNAPRKAVYPNATCIVEDERQVYPEGAIRRVEFYPSIQLRKFKSSWGQSMDRIAERNKP